MYNRSKERQRDLVTEREEKKISDPRISFIRFIDNQRESGEII